MAEFAPLLDEALAAGDVACLQLRLKNTDNHAADEALIAEAIAQLMPVAHRHDVAFILNDNPELAAKYDCDGAHIGQDDMAYAAARAIMGDDKIIGVTCHDSKHLAMEAGEAGADYVAFGAFYETQTKQAKTQAPLDILSFLARVCRTSLCRHWRHRPIMPAAGAAGADFIAASSSVWQHGDGAQAVRAFNEIFDATHEK